MYGIDSKYFDGYTTDTYRHIDILQILIQICIGNTDTRTHLHIKIYYFITLMCPCIRRICAKNNRKAGYSNVSVLCLFCVRQSCCNMHW